MPVRPDHKKLETTKLDSRRRPKQVLHSQHPWGRDFTAMPERQSLPAPGGFRESCHDGGGIHAGFETRPFPILGQPCARIRLRARREWLNRLVR